MRFNEGLIAAIGITVSMAIYVYTTITTMKSTVRLLAQQALESGVGIAPDYLEQVKSTEVSIVCVSAILIAAVWVAYYLFSKKDSGGRK